MGEATASIRTSKSMENIMKTNHPQPPQEIRIGSRAADCDFRIDAYQRDSNFTDRGVRFGKHSCAQLPFLVRRVSRGYSRAGRGPRPAASEKRGLFQQGAQ